MCGILIRLDLQHVASVNATLNREKDYLWRKSLSSLSYYEVQINGVQQGLSIINSDVLNQKKIYSLPDESILAGSLIEWNHCYWLVTEVDPNKEVYTRAVMAQCNHILRWITKDGVIVERWCIISDGTKYTVGETTSSNENSMSLGDTRISVALARDEHTVQLTREFRFLIDDIESDTVLAYRLTKPFKIGGVFSGHGVMNFILTEVNTEDSDNLDLRIADYYKYLPKSGVIKPPMQPPKNIDNGKKVWL